MEREWKRQASREREREIERNSCSIECIREIEDLDHLDHALTLAGNRLVILDLYNNACGVCHELEHRLRTACKVSYEVDALELRPGTTTAPTLADDGNGDGDGDDGVDDDGDGGASGAGPVLGSVDNGAVGEGEGGESAVGEVGATSPVFLKHNIRDERDDLSDIAKFYGMKHAPAFLVFQQKTKRVRKKEV